MVAVDVLHLPTPQGQLALYVRSGLTRSQRPLVIMLHGARRTAAHLAPWVERLAEDADVMLIDLPGHGQSEAVIPATLEAIGGSVRHAIGAVAAHRRVILVGESLGGLVALSLAGRPGPSPIVGVIACDPPMSTGKLWTLQSNLLPDITTGSPSAALLSLAWEMFGLAPDRIEERIYYTLLDSLQLPTAIIAGDLPLFPSRLTGRIPCVFDAVDRYVVQRFYSDTVQLLEVSDAGHLLLSDAAEQCFPLIRQAICDFAGD